LFVEVFDHSKTRESNCCFSRSALRGRRNRAGQRRRNSAQSYASWGSIKPRSDSDRTRKPSRV
jgi:hypothetical protein